jgi:hypothetical protein
MFDVDREPERIETSFIIEGNFIEGRRPCRPINFAGQDRARLSRRHCFFESKTGLLRIVITGGIFL